MSDGIRVMLNLFVESSNGEMIFSWNLLRNSDGRKMAKLFSEK